MVVKDGALVSWRDDPTGIDTRNRKRKTGPIFAECGWHYGCSLIAPTEAYLSINGWEENCDGLGFEDVVTGHLLSNAGWNFIYDPSMMTYESSELHHIGGSMKRTDKGISPHDKSHAILASTRMRKWAPNYWGYEELRGFRQRILNGEPFPNRGIPKNDWYDNELLRNME
jgi:hypothetical protein